MKLGFIVAGVQKAGTTALFRYLSTHPELSAPSRKELHFFDDESIDCAAPNYDLLDRHYRSPGNKIRGDTDLFVLAELPRTDNNLSLRYSAHLPVPRSNRASVLALVHGVCPRR